MLIEKLGEFGLIDRIKKLAKADSSVIKGIGDDCAVIKLNKEKYLLYTCDMLVENVDFTSKDSLYWVGRKALAVSISDIASCAGIPKYAVLSLGLPKKTRVKDIDLFSKGLFSLAREYKVNVVGGDISRADKWTIDVSLIGEVKKNHLVLRNNAKIDDIIFTTGAFGGSLSGKHLKFTPRVKEALFLVNNFKINSMIDVSDGLSKDLGHILKDSAKGAVIYQDLIPVNKGVKNIQNALSDGEDFELLFTMPVLEAAKLIKASRKYVPIGYIVSREHGLQLVDSRGRFKKINFKGYEHFK